MTATWQTVDQPGELLLGDKGPGQVQGDRLAFDYARQGLWAYGLAPAQVNPGPQAFVTAPVETGVTLLMPLYSKHIKSY